MSTKRRHSAPPKRGSALPFLLHALLYREEDAWLAHCLEFDTVTQGDTPAEARKGIENALDALIADAKEHNDFPGLFRPAPRDLWQKFSAGERAVRTRRAVRPDLSLDARLVPA